MTISKLQADAQGTSGNSTGEDVATAVNAVIDLAEANAESLPTKIDIASFISGKPTDAEKLITYTAAVSFSLPADLTGSQAYGEVVSTAAATFDIIKNGGSSLGTINFAIGENVATFTFSTLTSFGIGDRLQIVNQATADTTLADISITIRGDL
jgi:hypothetical protein